MYEAPNPATSSLTGGHDLSTPFVRHNGSLQYLETQYDGNGILCTAVCFKTPSLMTHERKSVSHNCHFRA
jgi:hypothetical protein